MKELKILFISLVLFSSCNEDKQADTFSPDDMVKCTFDLVDASNNSTAKPSAAIIDWPRWQIGQTIKIKFLDGTIAEQEVVKLYAGEWLKYANLTFEYVPSDQDAVIRIGFNVGEPGAWSLLGMKSAYGSGNYQNEPSMRLGPVLADENSKRTILHEFGHALGLVHETTNPAANIKWNLPKVYEYYYDLRGWSKEEVDENIINKRGNTSYSEYDPHSIMHYYIDPSLTTDGVRVPIEKDLSPIDKVSINKWYPFDIVSILDSGQSINDLPWKKRIKSPNRRYSLEFESGLLQVNDLVDNKIIWKVGNDAYKHKSSCYFESSGNITIKGAPFIGISTRTIWTSNTSGFPGAKLQLKDNGNLELIYNGAVKWSSTSEKL